RLLATGAARYVTADLVIDYAEVNGGPAALVFMGGQLFGVVVVDLTEQGDQVRAIYSVFNPAKLTAVAGAVREHPGRASVGGVAANLAAPDPSVLESAVQGADAVLSGLTPRPTPASPPGHEGRRPGDAGHRRAAGGGGQGSRGR